MKETLYINYILIFCIIIVLPQKVIAIQTKSHLSKKYVNEALVKIDNYEFQRAFKLVKKAIKMNPTNEEAKKLYTSLSLMLDQKNDIFPHKKKSPKKSTSLNGLTTTSKDLSPPITMEPNEGPIISQKSIQSIDNALFSDLVLSAGIQYTSLYSKNSNIQNKGSLIGSSFHGEVYTKQPLKSLGLSFDYSKSLFSTEDSDASNISIYRICGSLLFRVSLFENNNNKTLIRANMSYQYFSQNNNDLAITYFNEIWGPGIGLYISDPILSRFIQLQHLQRIQFFGQCSYFYIQQNNSVPLVLDFNTGVSYKIEPITMSISYNYFTISLNSIQESYSSLKYMVHYYF